MLFLESIYIPTVYLISVSDSTRRLVRKYSGFHSAGKCFSAQHIGPNITHHHLWNVSCSEINLTFTVNNKYVNRRDASDFP